MVYDDIYEAKTAVDHLSGFNVANRYLIVLYYNTNKATKKVRAPTCIDLAHENQTGLYNHICCSSICTDNNKHP